MVVRHEMGMWRFGAIGRHISVVVRGVDQLEQHVPIQVSNRPPFKLIIIHLWHTVVIITEGERDRRAGYAHRSLVINLAANSYP